MSDESASNLDGSVSLTPQLPPLRIHHFMLWTVVSAAFLTVLKSVSDEDSGTSYLQGGSIFYLLIQALALCGLGLGIAWKLRGLRFFHQPGHTAFIGQGINAVFMMLWAVLWKFYGFEYQDWDGASLLSILLFYGWYALYLFQAVLSFVFACQFWNLRHWRYFFIVRGLVIGFQMVSSFVINFWLARASSNPSDQFRWYIVQSSWPLICSSITMVCLAIVAWKDYRQQIKYHWTHWLGVSTWPAIWLAMLAALIWSLIFLPEWLEEVFRESTLPAE